MCSGVYTNKLMFTDGPKCKNTHHARFNGYVCKQNNNNKTFLKVALIVVAVVNRKKKNRPYRLFRYVREFSLTVARCPKHATHTEIKSRLAGDEI